nr:hypothetical protein [Mastigocoleus sp. MO_167.B18]
GVPARTAFAVNGDWIVSNSKLKLQLQFLVFTLTLLPTLPTLLTLPTLPTPPHTPHTSLSHSKRGN